MAVERRAPPFLEASAFLSFLLSFLLLSISSSQRSSNHVHAAAVPSRQTVKAPNGHLPLDSAVSAPRRASRRPARRDDESDRRESAAAVTKLLSPLQGASLELLLLHPALPELGSAPARAGSAGSVVSVCPTFQPGSSSLSEVSACRWSAPAQAREGSLPVASDVATFASQFREGEKSLSRTLCRQRRWLWPWPLLHVGDICEGEGENGGSGEELDEEIRPSETSDAGNSEILLFRDVFVNGRGVVFNASHAFVFSGGCGGGAGGEWKMRTEKQAISEISYPAGTVASVHEHLINLLPYEEDDGWTELTEGGDVAGAEGGEGEGGGGASASAWAEKARAHGGSVKERQLARLLPVLFLLSSSLMPTARRYPLLLRDQRLLHHVRTGLFGVDLAALSIPLDATSAFSTSARSAAAKPHLFFAKKLYLPLHPDSLCGFAASPRPRSPSPSPDPLWRTLRAHHLLPPNGLPILNPNWVPRLPNQQPNQQARVPLVVGESLPRDWVVVVSLVWSTHGGREGRGVAGGESLGLGEGVGEILGGGGGEGGAGWGGAGGAGGRGGAEGGEGGEDDYKEAADAMNRVIVMMRELFGEGRVVVYDEHQPLLQAKDLFSRAILFVGPTSPALSNLIFMPFNSTVIEILPRTVTMAAAAVPVVGQQRAATWHFRLASRLGVHHFLSACDPSKVNWHSQEHCHVDEVYGTVTALIRNNPALLAFTGLPDVSFPPDEPASIGDFRASIPGSRLRPGTEADRFKEWMTCVAERGEWRYNATPRVLPWEEKQLQSCDARHMKQGGVAGAYADRIARAGWDPSAATAAWKVRESLKYEWVVPRERCAGVSGGRQAVVGSEGVQGELFSKFDGRALCELAARRKDGLRIAFIGDSLTREHHYSFMNNIIKHIPKPAEGTITKQKCLDWIDDTVTVTCAGYRIKGCPNLEIHYVATTRLMRVQEEKLERAAWLHVPWQQVPGIRNAHVIIMNRGAHYKPAVKVVKAVKRVVRFLRYNHPDRLLIYRTTPPGHLNCLNHSRPISERQDGAVLPFRWGEFKEQNERVRGIVEEAGGVFMDVDPMMALRPDGHRGVVAKDKVDCLHYCLPGPEDTWSEFLYNIIQRLVPLR